MKALNNSLRRLVSYKHVEVKFHQEGRQALFSGITKLNQAVMQTLGPKVILMQGSNIAIDYEIGDPKVTKDGVTVAKHIEFKDIWEDLGSKLIKFSANESNVYAGDGTTTSTILTTYILQNGLKYLEKGFHPILVKEGLVRAGNLVDNYLIDRSIPITNELELYAICKIACNNDTSLADMIFSGLLNAGKDGGFLIEEGTTNEDKLCVSNGFVIPRGYASDMFGLREFEYFIIRIKLENPLILVGSCKFHDLSPILHILEHAKKTGRSLVIAGEDIDKEVLSTILQNNEKSDLSSCAINFPGESNYSFLEDLANFTGATMINSYTINEIQLSDLGSSKKVNIDSMKSCFIDGKGDTSLRRSELSHEIINETDPMSQNVLRERLQRLSGKMVVIEMGVKGGKIAMGERRDRIVDSLNSVKSAIKEGFLPGGGSSLIYASRVLSKLRYGNESDIGIRILQDALKVPGYLIAKTSNIGIAAVDILLDQDDEEIGLDADKGDICNLVDRGIIDSTGVVRQAVRAAVSISQMILSTSAVVAKTVRYEPTRLHKYKKQMF